MSDNIMISYCGEDALSGQMEGEGQIERMEGEEVVTWFLQLTAKGIFRFQDG